ncbi:MAG: hypothetical protein IJE43_21005 [Alphaproteobacteria bacterium]|nr:hypothetical protein [Alphaproteobacteria bacterium]
MLKYLLAILICLNPVYANANDLPKELRSFGGLSDLLPVTDSSETPRKPTSSKPSVIPFIEKALPKAATYNITNYEQVFCYHVKKRPENYTGYTINNYAIIDYCGELDTNAVATNYEALFTQGPNIITTPTNCRIQPKVMLRFVRGVDYTDVLLSSPCHSFTVFYAGWYKSFNIKQGIINDLISQFDKKVENFNSPSLLKQTVANALINTVEEASKLDTKKREQELKMSWQKEETPTDTEETKPNKAPALTGWGKIKLRK